MFYYIDLDSDGNIKSYGESTDIDSALSKASGIVAQVTEAQYKLISACRGDIIRGIKLLTDVHDKIHKCEEYWRAL